MALGFLERITDAFKEITETYLEKAEADEEKRPQIEELGRSLKAWTIGSNGSASQGKLPLPLNPNRF